MLALVPVIILAGGLTVGAFDSNPLDTEQFSVEKSELEMTAEEIAALEPFPYD